MVFAARRRAAAATLVVLPLLLVTACKSGGAVPVAPIIPQYVPEVGVVDDQAATASLVDDPIPVGETTGPVLTATPTTMVINGGSVQVPLSASAPFSRVRVAVEPLPLVSPSASPAPSGSAEASPSPDPAVSASPVVADPTGTPAIGYQEVTLSAPATTVTLLLTIATTLPAGGFALYYAAVDAAGTQGPLAGQSVGVVPVGSGDIQISVSWDVDSDVDLHVIGPDGGDIYWATPTASSGGTLDADSNAQCDIDHLRNENVTWKTAVPGTYTVRVDYWQDCGAPTTDYVVTVRAPGQPIRTFTGTFTGTGDKGGKGSGTEITTFTVGDASPSPTASPTASPSPSA